MSSPHTQALHRASTLLSHLNGSINSNPVPPQPQQQHQRQDVASSSTDAALLQSTTYSGAYQYSLDPNNLLTSEQRKQYDEKGYILIKGLISQSEIDKWTQHFLKIANGEEEPVATMTVMRDVAVAKKKEKGEHAITKLQDWQDDECLFTYCTHPGIRKYVEAIVGEDFKSVHTMLINKPTDVGLGSSRHPPHQDLWYFPFRPAHMIVASWTAMQKIDRENGCLFVQPGTHKGTLHLHTYPNDGIVNKAYHGIHNLTEKDGDEMLHVEMEAGDTLFFHPLLIHGSGRNNSARFRKAISTHFGSTHCTYAEMTGTLQEDIAKEIEKMAARKGIDISFNDVWRMKARLVQGKEDTL